MAGVDDKTGKWLDGFDHVGQSLGIIFTTALASRIMRRTFGSAVPAVLGRSMTPALILRWKTAMIVAIELWEPRFRVVWIYDKTQDTQADVRSGKLSFRLIGHYRPRGHLGDDTEEPVQRGVGIGQDDGGAIRLS